jgi:predicted nucleic acid-binding protein
VAAKKQATAVLVDTGVWVEVERGRLSVADLAGIIGDVPVFGSPVSIAELTQAAEMSPDEAVKLRRRATLQRLRDKAILPIDAETGLIFGKLAAQLVRRGRGSPTHRIQDVWIAAQAVQHKIRLITYNRKDFDDIPGLDIQVLKHGVA